jgi:hypothetical protein
MTEKQFRVHPLIEVQLRNLKKEIEGLKTDNDRLAAVIEDERQARLALEKKEVHIDDMPGKQLPYKFQINIPLTGGTQAPTSGTVNISRDGPFIARRIFASCLITDAPTLVLPVPPATVWDYADWIGRFAPVSSSGSYDIWARYATLFTAPAPGALQSLLSGYVPPPIDFEWEYNDGGSDRNRQDKPISGDLFARSDDSGYFMNNEIFAAGTTISFTISPTRAIPTISQGAAPNTVTGNVDLLMKITFDGFKVLQPLEM